MGLNVMLGLSMASLFLMHWFRVIWITNQRRLLAKIPDLNYPYIGFLDGIFVVFFSFSMLFSTPRLIEFTHRTMLLVITFLIQGVVLILLSLILLADLSSLIVLPLVFIILPISQAISYVIILIDLQRLLDTNNKSLKFLNFLISLWHSIASVGHILGYAIGLLLSRGVFELSNREKYVIHLFLAAGFSFLMAILIALFHRENDHRLSKKYGVPNEFLNNSTPEMSCSASSNLTLSPNISGLISIEKNGRDPELSNYSRFSRESSVANSRHPILSHKKSDREKAQANSWVFKNVLKNSMSLIGVKTFYWGFLFWGAFFLNLRSPTKEVWLGNMSMILYEAGQIVMALLFALKRFEFRKTLILYPLAFLFASVGLLFLLIADPTHWVFYVVFLIIGGFIGSVYSTVGEVICEILIQETDASTSVKTIRKAALGIDILSGATLGFLVFLMNFILDWLMICFCGLSVLMMLYWGFCCCKECHKKERGSEESSAAMNSML